MKTSNKQLKNTVVILFVVLAFVLLFLSLHSLGAPTTLNISQNYPSSNLVSVEAYGTNSFLYSNSDALMVYNYATGNISQLSPSVGLDAYGIDSISISTNDQFILFHDQQVVNGGALYQQLESMGLNPSSDYWWLYNVNNRSFQPLPQTTLIAKLNNNSVYALVYVSGSEHIINYGTSNLLAQSTINVSGVSNFFPVTNGFLLQTPNNSILFTSNGIISQVLVKNSVIVAVTPNNQQAVIVTGISGIHQLALMNIAKDTTETLASNITNQPVWLSPDVILYTTGKSIDASHSISLYSYDLTNKKIYLWKLEGNDAVIGKSPITPVAIVGPQVAVVSNSESTYYLIGSAGLVLPHQSL